MARFMYGRNGADQLCWALFIAELVLSLLPALVPGQAFAAFIHYTTLFLCVYLLFRMFSRNIPARQKEYYSFLKVWTPVQKWFRIKKTAFRERKQYKYFRCPGCRAWLRLPRGTGVVTVTCSRCHTSFTQKS
mgnify:FL=1